MALDEFVSTRSSLAIAGLSDPQSIKEVSIGILAELALPVSPQSQQGTSELAALLVSLANNRCLLFEFFPHGAIASVLVYRMVHEGAGASTMLVDHVYLAPGLGALYLRGFFRRAFEDPVEMVYTRLQAERAVSKAFQTRKTPSLLLDNEELKPLNAIALASKLKAFRDVGAALFCIASTRRLDGWLVQEPFHRVFRLLATAVSLGHISISRDALDLPIGFSIWRYQESRHDSNMPVQDLMSTPSAWREGACLVPIAEVSSTQLLTTTN